MLDGPGAGPQWGASDTAGDAPRFDGLAPARRPGPAIGFGLANAVADLVPGHLSAQHLRTSSTLRFRERYVASAAASGDVAHGRRVTSVTLHPGPSGSKMRP